MPLFLQLYFDQKLKKKKSVTLQVRMTRSQWQTLRIEGIIICLPDSIREYDSGSGFGISVILVCGTFDADAAFDS